MDIEILVGVVCRSLMTLSFLFIALSIHRFRVKHQNVLPQNITFVTWSFKILFLVFAVVTSLNVLTVFFPIPYVRYMLIISCAVVVNISFSLPRFLADVVQFAGEVEKYRAETIQAKDAAQTVMEDARTEVQILHDEIGQLKAQLSERAGGIQSMIDKAEGNHGGHGR